MKTNYEVYYAANPADVSTYNTERIRKEFLVPSLMKKDEVNMAYSFYDRLVVGGAVPGKKRLNLEAIDPLKAEFFLQRRELGVFNLGGQGQVIVDGEEYNMDYLDALYIGKNKKDVIFVSENDKKPAHFYFNSALAHTAYPVKKVTPDMADTNLIGSEDGASLRSLNKMIAGDIVETCQLQMGYTDVKEKSVWNTMPAHTHERRMEAYFYFEVDEGQVICHFMGEPKETRHIFMTNEQAVISPSWSIHGAAGTANYKFIWGMAGENKDFGDMDKTELTDLR